MKYALLNDMRYLTFLDYSALEETDKSIEAKLNEREIEIQLLRQRDSMNTDALTGICSRLEKRPKYMSENT